MQHMFIWEFRQEQGQGWQVRMALLVDKSDVLEGPVDGRDNFLVVTLRRTQSNS